MGQRWLSAESVRQDFQFSVNANAQATNILYTAWPDAQYIKASLIRLVNGLRGRATRPGSGHALDSYRCGEVFLRKHEMRHLFITLLLTFGLFENAFSDAGNCVKYEVDVGINDGRIVRGFVYIVGYERRFKFNDITFLDYLKRSNPADTLTVYRNIQRLKFPVLTGGAGECEVLFDAATPDNVVKILKSKIKVIRVIDYGICNNCDVADEKTGYYSNGIYPKVITELTRSELELLQAKPVALVSFGHDVDDNTDGYWMISYTPQYNQAELEKMKNGFLLGTDKLLAENNWDKVQVRYRTLKSELRKKKIVMFKIEFAL